MRRDLSFLGALALLVGTQIGAGILGLPKVLAPLGFFWGTVVLFLSGMLLALTAIMLVEALYLTNPRYHYFELTEHHLGPRMAFLLTLAILYAGYGALIAYTAGLGSILADVFGGSPQLWAGIAWAVLSVIILLGLRISGAAEESLTILMILLISTIFLWALPEMRVYTARFDLVSFTVAFGVAVFAFSGHLVIPEIVQGVKNMGRTIMAILAAFSLVFLMYTFFSLAITGVAGENVPEIGTEALVENLGTDLAFIAILLPFLTITTSFIGMGIAQKDILRELVRNRFLAWLLAVFPPILVYYLGAQSFVGAIWLASFGILVASGILPPLLLIRARRERRRALTPLPDWLVSTVLAFFALILLYSVVSALFGWAAA